MRWGGRVLAGFYRFTGGRNRCYACGSEYHLAPKCPQRRQGKPDGLTSPPSVTKAPRSSVSSILVGNLAWVCTEGARIPNGGDGQRGEGFSTASGAGGKVIYMKEDGVAIFEEGAAANLVCFQWLNHHNSTLGKVGLPRVTTYPAPARFDFGIGRIGDGHFAADITAGIAGYRGNFTALVLDADIPALLRTRAVEALGRQPACSCDTLTPGF